MKRMIMLLTVAIMMLCLPGCDQGELYHITIKNMTGVEISALYLAPETNSRNIQNYLTENLAIDGTVDLSLGRLTEKEVREEIERAKKDAQYVGELTE